MDALTHAIEGYITKAAWEMTDMFHIKAIEVISEAFEVLLKMLLREEKNGTWTVHCWYGIL